MLEFFDRWKPEILAEISAYLQRQAATLAAVNRWGPDASRRLAAFAAGGKMIRGGLVALGYELFAGEPPQPVRQAAAAMELLQSAFLVHDDIMDSDLTRRGLPTVFDQYSRLAADAGIAGSRHVGEAMGICAGDVGFFFAFDLLARLALAPGLVQEILHRAHATVIETCIAQMQDVYLGASPASQPVGEQDVLAVYHYKTGRYTFALPLQIGAIIAGGGATALAALDDVGEHLGTIFQIKDDELGLYGSEQEIGKPVGSDVAAGKKTIYYVYLMDALDAGERLRAQALFGGSAPGQGVREIRRLIESHGVRERVAATVGALAVKARAAVAALPGARQGARSLLIQLLDYNLSRVR